MGPIVLGLAACSPPDRSPSDEEVRDPDETPARPDTPVEQIPPCVPRVGPVLNELSSSNASVLADRTGESVDWIELYNPGSSPIELGGWSLSDDPDQPERWSFPEVELAPGGFLVIYASGREQGTVLSWDTRIDRGDGWRYLPVLEPPDPGWTLPGFDDRSWAEGPSGFGQIDDDDATEVAADTIYLRKTFEITASERQALVALILQVDYDDGFVAWLDGVEVARAGVGSIGVQPAWDDWASSEHEARLPQGLPPSAFELDPSMLSAGSHTLALEVHDASSASADLSLVPFLTLGFSDLREGRASTILAPQPPELHTNFSLGADGERIRLYDPEGCEADDLDPGPLLADQSYGRTPDGSGELGYFLEPTPGAPNLTESRPGFAETPSFSPPPGHYPGGTELTVSAGPQAVIRAAFGGKEPSDADPAVSGPIPTGDRGEAMVVRAQAFEEGLWPSRIATATYLLRPAGPLPVVSVVTDPPHLWDDEIGIYTFGSDYEPEPPFDGANFQEDWERPVHVEEWDPDGTLGFSVDAGISIHGGHSRLYEQKSLSIKLRSGYGDASIEHDLFPGLGITSFTRLLLRSAGNDWHGSWSGGRSIGAHLRDPLMHRIASGQDLDLLASRPAEVYLNGEFWGIYYLNEWPDLGYVETHHGYSDIDLLEKNQRIKEGDGIHYARTLDWLRTHDLSDPAAYAEIESRIDVDEFATYLAFEIFYDNGDWPGNNIKYWRPRTGDGRWRWMMYDTDFGLGPWGRPTDNDSLARALATDGPEWPNPPWSTELFRLLVQNPEFTETFVNRYADCLNTALVPETTRALLHGLEAELAPVMPRQIERWGTWTDGVTTYTLEPGEWESQIRKIDRWLGERPAYARDHLVSNFGLAGTFTLKLESDPPGAGTFRLAAVEVDGPFEGIYFLGIPVTVTAIPAPGHSFRGWSDPDLPADPTATVAPSGPLSLVARFD